MKSLSIHGGRDFRTRVCFLARLGTVLLGPLATIGAEETAASPPPSAGAVLATAPILPEAIASFGAAECDGWLYVYSGHIGRAHEHSRDNITTAFRRLELRDGGAWEDLPTREPLQGASLVAHRGKLYRVGGLSARNGKGESEDLHSVSSFESYDPPARRWDALPPLPEPRSSHDAAVLDGTLHVVGGWRLAGGTSEWTASAFAADLPPLEMRWRRLPDPPFRARALAVAPLSGRLVVLGGMEAGGRTSRSVHVFDPRSGAWARGADLPGDGFGLSAAARDGSLYATGRDGLIFRLSDPQGSWSIAGTTAFPRMFHRLVPVQAGKLLAVGGAARGAHLRVIEPLALDAGGTPSLISWSIPWPGRARNRQAAALRGDELILAGGNRSLEQHDFSPESFVDEVLQVHLGSLEVKPLDRLPAPRQSMEAIFVGREPAGGESMRGSPPGALYLLGGFANEGDAPRSRADVFRLELPGGRWSREGARLPVPRTQLGTALHGGKIWALGGLDYDAERKDEPFRFVDDALVMALDGSGFQQAGTRLLRPRRAFGGALLEDRYYLVGGMAAGFKPVEVCDVLDLGSATWSEIPAPRRPRISPELAAVGGKLYLAGGSSPRTGGGFEPNPSLEVYDPRTRSWSVLIEKLPLAPEQLQMLSHGDRLLIFSTQAEGVLEALLIGPGGRANDDA